MLSTAVRDLTLDDCHVSVCQYVPSLVFTSPCLRHLSLSGTLDGGSEDYTATILRHASSQLLSLTIRSTADDPFLYAWLNGLSFPRLDRFEAHVMSTRYAARRLRGTMRNLRFLVPTAMQWPRVPPEYLQNLCPHLQEIKANIVRRAILEGVRNMIFENDDVLPYLTFFRFSVSPDRVRRSVLTDATTHRALCATVHSTCPDHRFLAAPFKQISHAFRRSISLRGCRNGPVNRLR